MIADHCLFFSLPMLFFFFFFFPSCFPLPFPLLLFFLSYPPLFSTLCAHTTTYSPTTHQDPFLKDDPDLGDVDSDSEDLELKVEDAILLVGRSDEERNRLEV
jgi:hypothetical protein